MRHYVVLGALAALLALGGCVSATPIAQVETVDAEQVASAVQAERKTLRVMTLNLAHGRSDGFHQALLSDSDITENLDHVATYRPDSEDLATFGSLKRLDWVLVSAELEFTRHEVLSDVVSDHKGVVVDVRFKAGGADDSVLADAKLADAKEVE